MNPLELDDLRVWLFGFVTGIYLRGAWGVPVPKAPWMIIKNIRFPSLNIWPKKK